MTAKGILVECIEDMEITNLSIEFKKQIFYTALLSEKIFVIDRNYKNQELTKELFNRHFKIK